MHAGQARRSRRWIGAGVAQHTLSRLGRDAQLGQTHAALTVRARADVDLVHRPSGERAVAAAERVADRDERVHAPRGGGVPSNFTIAGSSAQARVVSTQPPNLEIAV